MKSTIILALFAALVSSLALGDSLKPVADKSHAVDSQRLVNADKEPGNWLTHGRTYSEQRFSPLNQINDKNVNVVGFCHFFCT